MQAHPDDHTDEPTEQTTPDHSIPDDVHPVLKPSETALGQVDATFAYPDGTRIYVEVKRWAHAAQQETSLEDARNLTQVICAATLGVPSEPDNERTFGSYRRSTFIRPLREWDVFEDIGLRRVGPVSG